VPHGRVAEPGQGPEGRRLNLGVLRLQKGQDPVRQTVEVEAADGLQSRPDLPPSPLFQKEGHHGLRPVLQEKEDFQKGPFRKLRLQEGLSQVQDPFPLDGPGGGPGHRQAEDGVPVL
jgi:hypothetical protein